MDEEKGPAGVYSQPFRLPKAGSSEAEYEDAWDRDDQTGRYAIADGASDSVFSRLWAELLVRQLLQPWPQVNDPATWREWLRPAQASWDDSVHSGPIPWYLVPRLREGAFATCLALIVRPGPEPGYPGQWYAIAVGDSCLFQVPAPDQDRVSQASPAAWGFPINNPGDFNQAPLALCTNPWTNEMIWPRLRKAQGTWRGGDTFVLATDALARWIMQAGVLPHRWDRLLNVMDCEDDSAFQRLIEDQRGRGLLRNDDVTLLVVQTAHVAEPLIVPVQAPSTAAPAVGAVSVAAAEGARAGAVVAAGPPAAIVEPPTVPQTPPAAAPPVPVAEAPPVPVTDLLPASLTLPETAPPASAGQGAASGEIERPLDELLPVGAAALDLAPSTAPLAESPFAAETPLDGPHREQADAAGASAAPELAQGSGTTLLSAGPLSGSAADESHTTLASIEPSSGSAGEGEHRDVALARSVQ